MLILVLSDLEIKPYFRNLYCYIYPIGSYNIKILEYPMKENLHYAASLFL